MNISLNLNSMRLKTNQNLHKFESPDSCNLKSKLLTQVRFNFKLKIFQNSYDFKANKYIYIF